MSSNEMKSTSSNGQVKKNLNVGRVSTEPGRAFLFPSIGYLVAHQSIEPVAVWSNKTAIIQEGCRYE